MIVTLALIKMKLALSSRVHVVERTSRCLARNRSGKHRFSFLFWFCCNPATQNETTRSEIQTLWEKGDTEELERRMRFE